MYFLLLTMACGPDEVPSFTPDTDTDSNSVLQATAGAWCPLEELIGVAAITLNSSSTPRIRLEVFDRPDPVVFPPVLTDGPCRHHVFDEAACAPVTCGAGTTCGYDAALAEVGCVPDPGRRHDVVITVTDGTILQTEQAPAVGALSEDLDPAMIGTRMSMHLTWPGVEIQTAMEVLPTSDISPGSRSMEGDSCAPGEVLLTWTDPGSSALVYSFTNNNHHLPQNRFTLCQAPVSDQGMAIPAAMMNDLSGSTCLEFQPLQHMKTAAAQTPQGCVEFRWEGRHTTL